MLSYGELYRVWRDRVYQLTADTCPTRLTNMIWLLVGLYQARSVALSLIARKLPIRVQKLSLVKRLQRFLANGAIQPRVWYRSIALQLLLSAAQGGQVPLILDTTRVSARHRLIMVAVAYRRRALPVAWTWVRTPVGHSTTHQQLALLDYVQRLIPEGLAVSLVGDSEFGNIRLMRVLDAWGWTYVLRQRGRVSFAPFRSTARYCFDQQQLEPGDWIWMGRVDLTRTHAYVTNVVLCWARGQSEPWYLATNLPCTPGAIRLYRRRMWIEELFGDLKRHGFDLECSRLGDFLRLSRLTLPSVCCMCGWWQWARWCWRLVAKRKWIAVIVGI